MLEKKTASLVRPLALHQHPPPPSATSPVRPRPLTRSHPSASRHAPHPPCPQQPDPFLFPAASAWLQLRRHRLQAHRSTRRLRCSAAPFTKAQWGATLLPRPPWRRRPPWCSRRLTTRTATPPAAAEPAPTFQRRRSCRQHTLRRRSPTLSARRRWCFPPQGRRLQQ